MEDSLSGLFALLATWNPIVLVIIGLGAIFLLASDWKYLKAVIKRAYNHQKPISYYPNDPGEGDIFIDTAADITLQYYAVTGWMPIGEVTPDLIHEWPEVADDPDERFEFTMSHDEAENLHFCFDMLFQDALANGLKEDNDIVLWDDITRAYRLTKEMQS